MGLDLSHGNFTMPYSAFNRMRQRVAKAAGHSYPPHNQAVKDDSFIYWGSEPTPGVRVFLEHSDCDGTISPEDCATVAADLQALLPEIIKVDAEACAVSNTDWRAAPRVERFIAACREAAAAREPLEFF